MKICWHVICMQHILEQVHSQCVIGTIPFLFWIHPAETMKTMQMLLDSENQYCSYNGNCKQCTTNHRLKQHTFYTSCISHSHLRISARWHFSLSTGEFWVRQTPLLIFLTHEQRLTSDSAIIILTSPHATVHHLMHCATNPNHGLNHTFQATIPDDAANAVCFCIYTCCCIRKETTVHHSSFSASTLQDGQNRVPTLLLPKKFRDFSSSVFLVGPFILVICYVVD